MLLGSGLLREKPIAGESLSRASCGSDDASCTSSHGCGRAGQAGEVEEQIHNCKSSCRRQQREKASAINCSERYLEDWDQQLGGRGWYDEVRLRSREGGWRG